MKRQARVRAQRSPDAARARLRPPIAASRAADPASDANDPTACSATSLRMV
jgi:hypothetical protein